MRPTFRLGRIAGVEVGFHWSLLAIGALLVGSLAGSMLPDAVPHAHGSYLSAAVLAVVLFFGSILAHELAHSIVARRQGQTVNGITLWLLGGVSELGSEAKNANDELRVAIAGPATSIALGVLFGVLAFAFDAILPAGRPRTHRRLVAGVRERRARTLQPLARLAPRRWARARGAALEVPRRSPQRGRSVQRARGGSWAPCSSPVRSRSSSADSTRSCRHSSASSC